MSNISHFLTNSWGKGSGLVGATPLEVKGDAEANLDLSLGIVADQLVPMAFSSAKLKSIYIRADQDCTLKTNSSSVPQETITLKAGIPFEWVSTSGIAYPFAGPVTAGYITTTVATGIESRILTIL